MTENNLTKLCPKCKIELPAEAFNRNKSHSDGLSTYCTECQREYNRAHYNGNRRAYLEKNYRQRRANRLFIQSLKENPCTDCGQKYHPYIMEFDHRDPSAKLYALAKPSGHSRKSILNELEKCDLVCANCHKMRTYRRHFEKPNYVLAGAED